MNGKLVKTIIYLFFSCSLAYAQQREALQQRAEQAAAGGHYGQAFERLHEWEHAIATDKQLDDKGKAAERYKAARLRMNMYMGMRKGANAMGQLEKMEQYANAAADETLNGDLLYNKAVCYYAFGQNDKGNAAFREMTQKLTVLKEYDKVEAAYKKLIAGGRKSGSAGMVDRAYGSYMAWKDSVADMRAADETNALRKQIQAGETAIAEKDSALASRRNLIVVLCTALAILAAVLTVGALLLMRLIYLTRKQKRTIRLQDENIALKAKFTGNISAQLTPALQRLDSSLPEVKGLLDFANHIQTLSQLEASVSERVETEEVSLTTFCGDLMNQIRGKVKAGVTLYVDVPKMSATLCKEYVGHILLHLLDNAAVYTPEGGHIRLEFKKRSAHKYQFLVSNTGPTVPEEKREDIFMPFREVRNLATGDGLGLPICRQMARKMNGDLEVDPEFVKGTRFVLSIHN